jgi:hypothetical protein
MTTSILRMRRMRCKANPGLKSKGSDECETGGSKGEGPGGCRAHSNPFHESVSRHILREVVGPADGNLWGLTLVRGFVGGAGHCESPHSELNLSEARAKNLLPIGGPGNIEAAPALKPA